MDTAHAMQDMERLRAQKDALLEALRRSADSLRDIRNQMVAVEARIEAALALAEAPHAPL